MKNEARCSRTIQTFFAFFSGHFLQRRVVHLHFLLQLIGEGGRSPIVIHADAVCSGNQVQTEEEAEEKCNVEPFIPQLRTQIGERERAEREDLENFEVWPDNSVSLSLFLSLSRKGGARKRCSLLSLSLSSVYSENLREIC